jgi:DnaJ like chaperone protein
MDYYDAIRHIEQRWRTEWRAQQRATKVGLPGDDPDRPLAEPEAFALLGVAPGCKPEELTKAYRRTASQWHPDRLDSMAPELRDYATRRMTRINEAYQKLKSRAG